MKIVLALVSLAAALAVGTAHAADRGAQRAVVAACKADAEKLCPGVKPGEGRVAACLKDKRDEVSDGCKAALKDAAGQRKGGQAAG